MHSWAYATARPPYGLGLTTEQSWRYTPREFSAFKKLHYETLRRWAFERADFYNAHWPNAVPFVADDFLTGKGREQRKAESMQDKMQMLQIKGKETALRQQIQAGVTPKDLPDWAYGIKGRPKEQKHG